MAGASIQQKVIGGLAKAEGAVGGGGFEYYRKRITNAATSPIDTQPSTVAYTLLPNSILMNNGKQWAGGELIELNAPSLTSDATVDLVTGDYVVITPAGVLPENSQTAFVVSSVDAVAPRGVVLLYKSQLEKA